MPEQFRRVATATITNLVTGQAIDVQGLRITFSITKTDKADKNKAKISIFNLNKKSRGFAQTKDNESGKPQTLIELRVGYGSSANEKVVFRGIGDCVSNYQAPNWVTTLSCNDGTSQITTATFEKKFPAGTQVKDIMSQMISSTGIATIIENSVSGILPKARSFSGPVLPNIEDLQSTYGFQFDIQDQEAIVRTNNDSTKKIYRIRVARDSGLIGSPRAKGDLVICDALINGDLKPSNYVDLQSLRNPELDGTYVIKKVDMKGDTWGGSWLTTMEMQRTKFVPIYTNLRTIDENLA